MSISLHIERLVLEGLALGPGQGRLVGAVVEAELARLVGAGGLAAELRGGVALPSLGAGALVPGHDEGPEAMGQRIARAIYAGIGASGEEGR